MRNIDTGVDRTCVGKDNPLAFLAFQSAVTHFTHLKQVELGTIKPMQPCVVQIRMFCCNTFERYKHLVMERNVHDLSEEGLHSWLA